MNNTQLYQAMFTRMSVRDYSPTPLSPEVLSQLEQFLRQIPPLTADVFPSIAFLGPTQINRAIQGPHYATAYAGEDKLTQLAAGYYLEHLSLYLTSLGYGSCYNGMAIPHYTCDRMDQKKAIISMVFGAPKKESQRSGPSSYKRKSLSEITQGAVPVNLAEAFRVSPSAVNAQPWLLRGDSRFLELIYFPKSIRSRLTSSTAYVDMGIALAHICVAARQQAISYLLDFNAVQAAPLAYKQELICRISLNQ